MTGFKDDSGLSWPGGFENRGGVSLLTQAMGPAATTDARLESMIYVLDGKFSHFKAIKDSRATWSICKKIPRKLHN
ncbi:hypothetical protein DC3_20390 [Deinococcus cellulosilyticus NBRC 106333 = KACC 11606]|uniref:Uncharacterized protein n=1 Tax=Deinococcus cellulosilyticus (strain DSM 18568 / NBRC 106333 / KACC 11606 / 5516J-15) TaxID=1223518 RepID=A0A511N0N3_DEIC1|nr:hypothetical protein DC3_20390 [Deinococcus cellulosilyticus NBRC 106333 = KACC 11606]